jgi:predicted HTH domain antitoxin
VILELPDDPAISALTPKYLLLELACALYGRNTFSISQGARMAGLERMDFQSALCDRGIPIHYTSHDLDTDLDSFRALNAA